MSRSLNLAVIPGDGIGQEVVAEGLKVLSAVLPQDVKLETQDYDFGAKRYHATGETLTDADLARLKRHDAILLGAIGDPSVPSGVLERGFLLKLRFAFDHHVNLRPSKLLPGVATPLAGQPEIDFVVVREGTEGPYTGNGGTIRKGTPHEVATEVSVNTAYGVERVVRDAFARAERRPRKHLTLVHKTNVLVNAGSVWWRLFEAVAAEHPDVTTDYMHIDAAMIRARSDDVIQLENGCVCCSIGDKLVQALAEGTRFPPRHCARCLKTCDPAKVPYCITHALIEAVKGNVEEGLFFCGANVGRLDRMYTVRELMDELVTEWRQNR